MSSERAAQVAERAALMSAGGTGVAAFTLNDWAIVIGIAATVATTLLNWYYKHKNLQLARRRTEREDDGDE